MSLEDIQTYHDKVEVTVKIDKGVLRRLKELEHKHSEGFDCMVNDVLEERLDSISIITHCIGHGEEWGANRAGDKPELSRYVGLFEPWLERFKLHGKEEVRESGAPIAITLTPNEWNLLGQPTEGTMVILSLRYVSK